MYKKFESVITKVEIFIVCFGLMLLIATVFLAALLRFFGIDMSISTDLAQLTFAWVCFIGADLALRSNRHMGVDMFTKKLPDKVRNAIGLFNYVVIFGFLVFATYYGINLCIVNAARKYNTLYISYSFATASCPVGCGLMCITTIRYIMMYVRNFIRNDYSSAGKEVQA